MFVNGKLLLFSSSQVNENGILSFFRPFSSNSPRNFSSVFSIGTLIAPFWSNIDLRQFGVIYYRAVTNGSDLLRATQLINELFPSVVTIVNEVTVVTWFEVAEATFNSTNSEVRLHYLHPFHTAWAYGTGKCYRDGPGLHVILI